MMEEKKTELEERLDMSLTHALRYRKSKKNYRYDPLNLMVKAKAGDEVQAFVKRWAEKNDVHLFVLDWNKFDLKYVNDYENGFLKDLSQPKTVMYLENYTGIEFEKRHPSNVYKNCEVGWLCKYAPNFLFAIATSYMDVPKDQFYRLDPSERSCFGYIDFMTDEEREARNATESLKDVK